MHSPAAEAVAAMVERQRVEQEGLVRMITARMWLLRCLPLSTLTEPAELSDEIRGERLRFVDAMREATAINVQSA